MYYRVAMDSDYGDFVQEVRDALQDGWECQGGVSVRTGDEGEGAVVFYQALVKENVSEEQSP